MESNEEIRAGDVVYLKSGGPALTVASVGHTGDCWCFWFVNSDLCSQNIAPKALTKTPVPTTTTIT
jgi:uncharacterized protein YodC (DUF2158 family)